MSAHSLGFPSVAEGAGTTGRGAEGGDRRRHFAVAPSAATNIAVTFSPPAAAAFSNAVIFASNGGNSTNSLAGQGLASPGLLSPALTSDGLVFSFNSVTGKIYLIQYKDDLAAPVPSWQTLQTVTGDGTLKIITNPTAVPAQRFYRLSAQ